MAGVPPYSGKAIVVTGGGGGIGRETARVLLGLGAHVVLVDVATSALESAAAALDDPEHVTTFRSDLGDYAQCVAALERSKLPLYASVHLAGISVPDPPDPGDAEVFDAVMAANVRNGYLMARAFEARHAGTVNEPARLVFASSLAYRRGGLDRVAYSASKGAIAGMIRALARRYAPNVLVNGVAPGIIKTSMTNALIAERGELLLREIPLRRFAAASEVASVIEFLLSPASSYVNGQIINIDGGTVHS